MEKRIMNIVNFVRGIEPRRERDLYTPVAKQIEIMKEYDVPNTFLLQYDAMRREDFRGLFAENKDDSRIEIGVWFENCRELIEKVGLVWNGRPGYDWDWYVNPGFLMAYTPEQREAIVDEVFRLYKEIFGEYPSVAGSWLLDSHSMNYMAEKYGMKAFCVCREQWAIDAYSLWGGYYNGGYYPSKNNMLCPAQTKGNQIDVPTFRMLGIDPIHCYQDKAFREILGIKDCWTMEPAGPSGKSGEIMDWYFREYYTNPCLSHSHATTGQENSFGWEKMEEGYILQIEKLVALRQEGVVSLEKLGDTGENYKRTFDLTPPAALSALSDFSGQDYKSVWYSSRDYRANLFVHSGRLSFRDINKFDESYKERYLHAPCESWSALYDNLPVLDSRLWSDGVRESGLFFEKSVSEITISEDENSLAVSIDFEDGTSGRIVFRERSIVFEKCGACRFDVGVPDSKTELSINGNSLCYNHNGFAYSLTVVGDIIPTDSGFTVGEKDDFWTLKFC